MSIRVIDLAGTDNFRDLGGYASAYGGTVKWGTLYRSDALGQLSPADSRALATRYGITLVIDFRNPQEQAAAPDILPPELTHVTLAPEAKLAETASQSAKQLRRSTEQLLRDGQSERFRALEQNMKAMFRGFVTKEENRRVYARMLQCYLQTDGAVLQHCKGGKDRTGFGSAVLLAALGVSKADIMADFLLSNACKREQNEKKLEIYRSLVSDDALLYQLEAMLLVKESYLEGGYEEIEAQYGSMDAFITQGLCFDADARATLCARYLEA